jgi:hypothetical protein
MLADAYSQALERVTNKDTTDDAGMGVGAKAPTRARVNGNTRVRTHASQRGSARTASKRSNQSGVGKSTRGSDRSSTALRPRRRPLNIRSVPQSRSPITDSKDAGNTVRSSVSTQSPLPGSHSTTVDAPKFHSVLRELRETKKRLGRLESLHDRLSEFEAHLEDQLQQLLQRLDTQPGQPTTATAASPMPAKPPSGSPQTRRRAEEPAPAPKYLASPEEGVRRIKDEAPPH